MESSLVPVRPVRPAAAYLGGKRVLSGRLVRMIDAIDHKTYVEPFVGMGGVFLRRTRQPSLEVINDLSRDVATLYRVLQRHYQAFFDMLKWQLAGRAEFGRVMSTNPDTLTDLERAARFLYLQRLAFGGKVEGRTFGISRDLPARFNPARMEETLADLHDRLAGVVIECLPYAEVIRRYDGPNSLFYLDPPYWGNEADYGPGTFAREDFQRLADQLAQIRGRFILSINATDGAREVFGRFAIEEVDCTYTIARGDGAKVKELIIWRPE